MANLLHRIASFHGDTGAAPAATIAKKPLAYFERRKTIEERQLCSGGEWA